MNKNGFAITSMVFGLIIIASLIMFLTLKIYTSSRKSNNDFVEHVESELHKS